MRKGRRRATAHCRECKHHYHEPFPHGRHWCWCGTERRIDYGASRTSPDWCPLGHLIPGVPYPTFSPGKDPYKGEIVHGSWT